MQNSSSSKTIGIVIVLVIVVVGIWLMTRKSTPDDVRPTTATTQTQTQPVTPQAPAEAPAVSSIKTSGSSDAALNQDTASLDAQINGLNSDATAAQTAQ